MESLGLSHQEILSFVGLIIVFASIIKWLLKRIDKLEHDKDSLNQKVYDLAIQQIETNNNMVNALEKT